MNAKRFLSLWLLAVLLASCTSSRPLPTSPSVRLSTPTPMFTAVPATETLPPTSGLSRLEPTACRVRIPAGETVECGDLVVPEDRNRPDGPTIRLHVAAVRSHSQSPAPDPVIHFSGGPGDSALSYLGWLIQNDLGNILDHRDLIVFDQRGTGYSEPSMRCPERGELLLETIDQNLSLDETAMLTVQADMACRDRLVSEGVNLAAYTSAENAADVNDLRIILGYDEWNLWGGSYGTRLALTVMRDYPQGVRSAVLDSVFPPQVDLFSEFAVNAERSFNLLFESCAADSQCNQAYPDLKKVFYQLVDQLNTQPTTVQLYHPTTYRFYSVSINGDDMVDLVFQLLYSTDAIPRLPMFIYEARAGRFSMLSDVFHHEGRLLAFFDTFGWGLWYSVECGEEAPFSSAEIVAAASSKLQPEIRNLLYLEIPGLFTVCPAWGARSADLIENQPVVSKIPTLVLAGEFDPVTPPAWGRLASQTLSHAYFFEFPAAGHAVLGSGSPNMKQCLSGIVEAFLDTPGREPYSDCLADVPGISFVTK
jgi:pimeloyl-ACP methyl ester carboxylesterase